MKHTRRLTVAVSACLLILSGLVATTAALFDSQIAHADPTAGSSYYIQNSFSGLVLDDTNWSTSNGTTIQQWSEVSGHANQQWTLISAGNGSYYIQNSFSGLVLDDTNWSTSNGTTIQQWSEVSGHANQQWTLVSAGNGSYYIQNRFSGLVLDDTNWSTSNGTTIQQWSLSNGANQQWNLQSVSTSGSGSGFQPVSVTFYSDIGLMADGQETHLGACAALTTQFPFGTEIQLYNPQDLNTVQYSCTIEDTGVHICQNNIDVSLPGQNQEATNLGIQNMQLKIVGFDQTVANEAAQNNPSSPGCSGGPTH